MAKPHTETDAPPMGRTYEVGGKRLLLHRSGSGGPVVVFLPGAGLIGLDYLNIQQEVAKETTAVIYDRGGTGWSDSIALPRSAADAAGELRSLLAAADVPAPYILVGHSLGGAYARRFAQLFPGETAGLVMLDPAHEGYDTIPSRKLSAQIWDLLKMAPALLDMRKFYRPMFERMFAAWPEAVRGRLIDYHLKNWGRTLNETANLQTEVLGEIRDGGALPDAPMIVLTAMGLDPFMAAFSPEPYLRDLNTRKKVFYDAFATSTPKGENRLVENAGHSTLHTDRPDAVVKAILDVMEAARASEPYVAAPSAMRRSISLAS